jgi:hypothetical protein
MNRDIVVPGCEQPPGDRESPVAELLLGGEPFAVGGEIPGEVSPTELAPFGVEVVVCPPAIRAGDAREVLAAQCPGLALMTVSGDPEERCPPSQRAPEGAPLPGCPPAGLVDVDSSCGADLLAKPGVRLLERFARPLHDRVDGASRELNAKQLTHELGGVATRDTVSYRQRRDSRL